MTPDQRRKIAPDTLTADRLREILQYDRESGAFTWRDWMANGRIAPGTRAGTINTQGYRVIRVDGRLYRAARLAWLYEMGTWPTDFVDHINQCRSDDSWGNLREATNSQNCMNKGAMAGTRSGLKGVSWCSQSRKWRAKIKSGGVETMLGEFHSAMDAHLAYVKAATEIHGKFARVA